MKFSWSQHGDERVVQRFSWLPVRIGDRMVWLERYWSLEKLISAEMCHGWLTIERWQGASRAEGKGKEE